MKDRTDRPQQTAARAEREKRLARALRANLQRRKAAAKAAKKDAAAVDKATQERS